MRRYFLMPPLCTRTCWTVVGSVRARSRRSGCPRSGWKMMSILAVPGAGAPACERSPFRADFCVPRPAQPVMADTARQIERAMERRRMGGFLVELTGNVSAVYLVVTGRIIGRIGKPLERNLGNHHPVR